MKIAPSFGSAGPTRASGPTSAIGDRSGMLSRAVKYRIIVKRSFKAKLQSSTKKGGWIYVVWPGLSNSLELAGLLR